MSGFIYRFEPLKKVLAEANIGELLSQQLIESAIFPGLEVKIDFDYLARVEAQGQFKVFVVRADHTVIGYLPFWLAPRTYHATSTIATVDDYYLDPEWRRGSTVGQEMFRQAFTGLKKLGVHAIVLHEKLKDHVIAETPLGRFFRSLGMMPNETVWSVEVANVRWPEHHDPN